MKSVAIDGVNIHYVDEGSPELPAMVFANSLGTDLRIWDGVASRLAGKWRTIRYDKRGHGLSDATDPPYSIEDHVADISGLVDHLGLGKAVVVGVSVGGLIGMGLAGSRPKLVQALIICDSLPRIGPPTMWEERIAAIEKGGIASLSDAVLERWFPPAFRDNPDSGFAAYRNMLLRTTPEGYIGTCAALRDADYTDELRKLAMPVMFLVGSNDGSTTPEAVRAAHKLAPGSRFEIIEGPGHIPGIEAPDEVTALIRDFLKENGIG